MFRAAVAFGLLLSAAAPAPALAENVLCVGPVYGTETIWRGTREAAKRAARRHWRNAVEQTPGLGEEFSVWGWAQHETYHDGSDGYFCRTKKVLFDAWHKCAAWGEPCNFDPDATVEPRSGVTPLNLDLAREESPLEARGSELVIARVTQRGRCPAGFILTARVFGAGTRGHVQLNLKDSAGKVETVSMAADDFRATGDGRRVATFDFVREFDKTTDRKYWLSVGALPSGGTPQRANPGKRVKVNCRTEQIDGLTVQPDILND